MNGAPKMLRRLTRLAPVAFNPDVFAAAVGVMARNPASVRMRRRYVLTGNPDVGVAVPALVALVPYPVAVLRRGRRYPFAAGRRRCDANVEPDLRAGDQSAPRKEDRGGGRENLFLHGVFSFRHNCSRLGRAFVGRSCGGDMEFWRILLILQRQSARKTALARAAARNGGESSGGEVLAVGR